MCIRGSRACLLRSTLAAGGGLGPHVGGPWRCQGLGLGPGLTRGRQNTPARAGALFYQDPGIQGMAQVGGGFACSGPYYQSNNCLIQGTFISELLDLRLRKVTVELLTGLPLRSLVAPSKEGPADIYMYIYVYIYTYISKKSSGNHIR